MSVCFRCPDPTRLCTFSVFLQGLASAEELLTFNEMVGAFLEPLGGAGQGAGPTVSYESWGDSDLSRAHCRTPHRRPFQLETWQCTAF